MTKKGISLLLIVKNEADLIERSLRSFKGVVDEILVGDTGSSDKTRELAVKHNARVLPIPWEDDFSKARNALIEHALHEWILFVDADEYLQEGSGEKLRQEIENADVAGYTISFKDRQENGIIRTYSLPRLFRNRKDIRYKNAIHETVMYDLERLCGEGMLVMKSEACIVHTGYSVTGEKIQQKLHRNIHILEKLYQANACDPFLLLKYGDNLRLMRRNSDALRVFFEAITISKYDKSQQGIYAELCFAASTLLINEGKLTEAENLCVQSISIFENVAVYYNLGLISWKKGCFDTATYYYKKVEECIEKGFDDPSGAYPLSLNALGEISILINKIAAAETYFNRSMEQARNFANPYFNLSRLSLLKNDYNGAIYFIKKAKNLDPASEVIKKIDIFLAQNRPQAKSMVS